MRQQHELTQGGAEWHLFRANHGGASEAAAMLNLSPYTTRSELLRIKSTGIATEVDSRTQAIFDKGHAVEALARSIIEDFLGEDLYQVTMSNGYLSASCDGLTMDESTAWECKQYNAKLFDSVCNNVLPEHHFPQCQQVLYVTGAEKLIFTCSDGDVKTVSMDIFPDKAQQDLLVSGWAQFQKDLAEYVPPIIVGVPKVEAILELPAVIVQVKGELTSCNITDMRPVFDKFLSEATVNLVTDNDFAQAEAESKVGRDAAKRCLATAKGVVEQTASISEVTRELEQYAAKFNALALSQEKAVKTQKEARKLVIINIAKAEFGGHVAALEVELHPIRLITEQPYFAESIKNKRLLSAIQDAVDSELARVKISADSVARMVRDNLKFMADNSAHKFLFSDLGQIIYKPFDDLKMLVENRIGAHEKAEQERIEAQRLEMEAEATRNAKAEAEKIIKDDADDAEALRVKDQIERDSKVSDEEQARISESKQPPALMQTVDAVIAQKRLAEDDRKNPPVVYAKKTEIHRPTDDEILAALVFNFGCSKLQMLDWLQEMDIETMRENLRLAV
jgi:putative phage-type endonuclease